jgi:hypothetical protein
VNDTERAQDIAYAGLIAFMLLCTYLSNLLRTRSMSVRLAVVAGPAVVASAVLWVLGLFPGST